MSNESNCFFCDSKCRADEIASLSYSTKYCCSYCGEYLLDPQDDREMADQTNKKFKIACVLNERRLKGLGGVALSDKTDAEDKVLGYPQVSIVDLLDGFPKKASEYFNKVLLNLSRLTEHPFDIIKLDVTTNKDYLHFYIPEKDGCYAFLRELAEQGYIRFNKVPRGEQWDVFFLTTQFWEFIENLQQTGVDSKQVFVAMWFEKSMIKYYEEGIKPAIEEAGYDPIRIDRKEYNGKVCDEIIAEINRSKFIVADFCGQRGGVYFEAGYAMGQGKPVIFTATEEELGKLHFDTRQYNHIEYDSPEDLRKKLYNRICATIV